MAETCYGHTGPDAVYLPGYGPCNPQAGSTSLCCEIGQTCLNNGLCVTPDSVYYNGGCTDSTYKAAICPTFCTSGDANFVVECHGAAVEDGDFCCSINGSTTCCNTASNGLGLPAAISSAQAVSATSILANAVPTSTDKGATSSSSATTETTFLPSTSYHKGTAESPKSKLEAEIIIPLCILTLILFFCLKYFRWFQRNVVRAWRHRQARGVIVELNPRQEDDSNKDGPQTQGVIQNGVEGAPVGAAEVEGSSAGPVAGPTELDADQIQAAPGSPPSSVVTARDLSPDGNPLHEPTGRPGSSYEPNLGAH